MSPKPKMLHPTPDTHITLNPKPFFPKPLNPEPEAPEPKALNPKPRE